MGDKKHFEWRCERRRSTGCEGPLQSKAFGCTLILCRFSVPQTNNRSLPYSFISFTFHALKKHRWCVYFKFESITPMQRVCIINHHLPHTGLLIAAAKSSESFAMWEPNRAQSLLLWSDSTQPMGSAHFFHWLGVLFDFAVPSAKRKRSFAPRGAHRGRAFDLRMCSLRAMLTLTGKDAVCLPESTSKTWPCF